MQKFKARDGFTLIEMMVVLAIIALIAVFAVPNIQNAMQNSRIKSVEAQARQIQNSFDQYYSNGNAYPDAPAATDTVAAVYTQFFGPAGTATEGDLTQFLSLPDSIGNALFTPRAYAVVQGASSTTPRYEFVIEVKNVSTNDRYIHITKSSVLRLADDATATGAYDTSTTNHSDALTGATASWVGTP